MVSTSAGWWRRHGWTAGILLAAFALALAVRTLFMAPLIQEFGPLYLYGGGSDSFYHSRVTSYIILNHANLIRDPLLNYPHGAINPREPLFDWMNALLGLIFAPLFGGNSVVAGAFFLDLGGPLWAALSVFPVYLIGREVASRETGLIAALTFPLLVGNIDSSTFGYANYLSFYTFFILLTTYAYLRTVRAVGSRRWVGRYSRPREILSGLRGFVRTERTAVKWAVFTGVCFGALALAWQGFSFFVAIVVVFLVFALIVERIRRVDSFGMYVATWIVGLIGFPIAMPYYQAQGLLSGWFDLPLLVYFGALLVVLPFVLLRDQPWVVSIPALLATAGAAIGALFFVNRNFFTNIVTGQGYFVKTLVYSTVAEAQAPSVDSLILGYGVVTFFLAFVGLALLVWEMVRHRFPRVGMAFLIFGLVSIYLPVSAAKFFYVGSAAFAILSAEAIRRVWAVAAYPTLRRNIRSLSDRGGGLSALRRSIKARHILVLLLVVGIILPNVWYSIDAGIPYNSKSQFNLQVYNTLPPPLRTAPGNSTQFYLGAAGTQLDTPKQYDEAGYNWLAQQDLNVPAPQRPAFISWWDYGFQAVSQGDHPTVADNFQNGIDPAGNFLLSQNESQAVGILTASLLSAEQTASGQKYLPAGLNSRLAADGVDLVVLHDLLANRSKDVALVLAHPERYLPVDSNHLDPQNAMYDAVSWFLGDTLSLSGVVQVYDDVSSYTHWSIRYAMVDSRLFPSSGSNTGIFYAPADLTDRVIGPGGAPTTYYTLSILGTDGNTYAVGSLPAGVGAVQYEINWRAPFYNTMLYHVFAGYNGTDVGLSGGIPGLPGAASNSPVEPGWMLQHFQVVYRTVYYCPYNDPQNHPGCFAAMNLPQAQQLKNQSNGTVDSSPQSYYSSGEAILEFFPGQPMTGAVQLPDGTPVRNARLTVYDGWGVPHMTTTTDTQGVYHLILPPGNDTVNVTTGPVDGLSQAGTTHLATVKVVVPQAIGFSPDAPTMLSTIVLKPASVSGIVYWNAANNSTFQPGKDPVVPGTQVSLHGPNLATRNTSTDASGTYAFASVPPGVYNLTVRYGGSNYSATQVFAGAGKTVNRSVGMSPAKLSGVVHGPAGSLLGATVHVRGPGGFSATTSVNASGSFLLSDLVTGNLTLTATGSGNTAAYPQVVSISHAGAALSMNLTLEPTVSVSVEVLSAGSPVAGLPVRFSPIVPLTEPTQAATNQTGPPTPSASATNSTLVVSDANGLVHVSLPLGNYSLYGFGLTPSGWLAGFESAYLTVSATAGVSLPPLLLGPAELLRGTVTTPAGLLAATPRVNVYDSRGDVLPVGANSSGSFWVELPAGQYTLSGTQQPASTGGQPTGYAAILAVNVTGPTTVLLPLIAALYAPLTAGVPTFNSGTPLFSAQHAVVQLSVSATKAVVTSVTNASGNVTLLVPSALPTGSSYCLSVKAPGFVTYSSCGFTPPQLAALGLVTMTLSSVALDVALAGAPSTAVITLNLTAQSPTAKSVSVSGGPTFQLLVLPGEYRVTAFAPATTGIGLWRPPAPVNATIGLGSQSVNLSIGLVHQVLARGALVLPPGLVNASISVRLSAPVMNLSLSGEAFTSPFLAAPSTYQVYALASAGNLSYSALGRLVVNSTGNLSGPIVLNRTAPTVSGNLTYAGSPVNASGPVRFTAPGNLSVVATAFFGTYRTQLPSNSTYQVSFGATALVGDRYVQMASAPGTTCTVGPTDTACDLALTGTVLRSPLTGIVEYGGVPVRWNGTARLAGPGGSANWTTVPVTDGAFSAALVPGLYVVYTSVGSSGALANITLAAVGPSGPSRVVVEGVPAWQLSYSVAAPARGLTGPAELNLTAADGTVLPLGALDAGSSATIAVPAGVYRLGAIAPASPYGRAVNATGLASVALLNGNAAVAVPLEYRSVTRVAFTLLSPTEQSPGTSGSTSFAFTLVNTGTAPVSFHLQGSPSGWGFAFTASNYTLGVALNDDRAGGEVTVTVPGGTAVNHAPVALEAVLADGSVIGVATPAPNVTIVPSYGLHIGASNLGASIGPFAASVPFYLFNSGNLPETLLISVADASRLAGLGWSSSILTGRTTVAGPTTLDRQTNQTYQVVLKASAGAAVLPGTVSVQAQVLNSTSGVVVSTTLTVPTLSLSLNRSTLTVTGPSLGSPNPLPDWVVVLASFVPAAALLIGLLTWRWWRTRRWRRR